MTMTAYQDDEVVEQVQTVVPSRLWLAGELAAAVLTDAIVRILPGVLNNEESALTDSFQDGLLAAPVYSRPAEFEGLKVPDVLMGGDHTLIEEWRFEQAVKRTRERRPDLLSD